MTHRILIAGGGPAGIAAALEVNDLGGEALLFEPAVGNGTKLTETVYPQTREALHCLGIEPLGLKPASVVMIGRDGQSRLSMSLECAAGCVDRNALDCALRARAAASGIDILPDPVVAVELTDDGIAVSTQNGVHRGQFLIDASGKNPITIGPEDPTTSGECLDDRFSAFSHFVCSGGFDVFCPTLAALDDGFAFVLPIASDRICVGVSRYVQTPVANIGQYFNNAIECSQALGKLLENATQVLPVIPVKNAQTRNRTCIGGRILRTGDALGFCDPFLWDGIGFALTTGKLAGQSCVAAIESDRLDAAGYASRADAHFDTIREHVHGVRQDIVDQFCPELAFDPHVSPALVAALFAISGQPELHQFAAARRARHGTEGAYADI